MLKKLLKAIRNQQSKAPVIRNLVFEGGSVQGIAYIGAMQELFNHGKYAVSLADIERIGGSSAGAITATLLGVGYDANDLGRLFNEVKLIEFLDGDRKEDFFAIKRQLQISNLSFMAIISQLIRNPIRYRNVLYKLQSDFGLFKGEKFREWIDEKIREKTGIKHLTFAELAQLKAANPMFKNLYLIGSNSTTSRSEIFSFEHSPNMIVSDAVRISTSIPLVFVPHRFYEKHDGMRMLVKSKHLYIDGGVIDNYPIWLFDKIKYLSNYPEDANLMDFTLNQETLGFRLISANQGKHTQPMGEEQSNNKSFLSFLFSMINCYAEKQESDHLHSADSIRTVEITTKSTSMFDFDLTDSIKKSLMAAGASAVQRHFNPSLKDTTKIKKSAQKKSGELGLEYAD